MERGAARRTKPINEGIGPPKKVFDKIRGRRSKCGNGLRFSKRIGEGGINHGYEKGARIGGVEQENDKNGAVDGERDVGHFEAGKIWQLRG